jgi:integrase
MTAPNGEVINAPSTFATKTEADAWLMAERRRMEDIEGYRPPPVREALAREAEERAARSRPPTFEVYAERWPRAEGQGSSAGARDDQEAPHPIARAPAPCLRRSAARRDHAADGERLLRRSDRRRILGEGAAGDVLDGQRDHGHGGQCARAAGGLGSPFAIRGAGSGTTPKRHTFATEEEVARLADLVPAEMRVVILLAAWCGLRRGEIQSLRRSDLEFDDAQPVILVRWS